MHNKNISSMTFFIGVLVGGFVVSGGWFINNQYLKSDNDIASDNNTIEIVDILPDIEKMTTFRADFKAKVSDTELIVLLNDKEIRLVLDENTKIYKEERKSQAELIADKEDYDKKRRENPNEPIAPELPFRYTEKTLDDLQENNKLIIDVESNAIGKSKVKAKNIRAN